VAALISVAGIVFVGMAGMSKENELPKKRRKKLLPNSTSKKHYRRTLFGVNEFGHELWPPGRSRYRTVA
jgi:hypothetical protein